MKKQFNPYTHNDNLVYELSLEEFEKENEKLQKYYELNDIKKKLEEYDTRRFIEAMLFFAKGK